MNDKTIAADFAPLALTLRGGRRVTLRSIRTDDAEAMQAAIGRLSAESRHMRFMSAVNELSPSMLKYAVNPVEGRDLALVAIADIPAETGEGWVVGGARYVADSALGSCEFAIAIDDDWQRSGLAACLMQALIRSARARGLKVMEGFILARNSPMRNLARRLGFTESASEEGPGVLRAWLDLRTAPVS